MSGDSGEVCTLCPRRCGVPRGKGFCGAGREPEVASVCVHRGEEPPISGKDGIVNIFFSNCNLKCIYCQNWQISSQPHPQSISREEMGVDCIVEDVCRLLTSTYKRGDGGEALLGFVTAAHYVYAVPQIVAAVRRRGFSPTVVYNSSGYESVEALRTLEGCVDVYLPDLKYMDSRLAADYSHAPDYPEVACAALAEMKRQVGASLKLDDEGVAYRGMLVRHLVLPGAVDNSLRCLDWLADNMPLSLNLSLMAQYFPPCPDLPSPLDRTITADEYAAVLSHAEALGFSNIWSQELGANSNYRPDFSRQGNPFEQATQKVI